MEFIKYFITEDIYLVPDNRLPQEKIASPEDKIEKGAAEKPVSEETKSEKAYPLTIITSDLEPKEEKLLNAILNAVKINIKDIQIIQNITEGLNSDKVIVFNSTLINDITPYNITNRQGRIFIVADDLLSINNDVEKKKKLWTALQQMFHI